MPSYEPYPIDNSLNEALEHGKGWRCPRCGNIIPREGDDDGLYCPRCLSTTLVKTTLTGTPESYTVADVDEGAARESEHADRMDK